MSDDEQKASEAWQDVTVYTAEEVHRANTLARVYHKSAVDRARAADAQQIAATQEALKQAQQEIKELREEVAEWKERVARN